MTEQLKALAEAATQGPWTLSDGVVIPVADLGLPWIKVRWIVDTRVYLKSDAAYIAAANPERILALIAENERIRKANDSLKTEVSDVYASNTGYRLELERVRGLIRQHLIHHEHGCVYLDEALGETK